MKNPDPELIAHFTPAPTRSPSLQPRARTQTRRLPRLLTFTFGGIVLLVALVHLTANLLLDHLVRPRLEAAISVRLPGATLRLGTVRYDFWRDRLRCASLELALPAHAPLTTGPLSLSGVHWTGLLAEAPDAPQLLRHARLAISDLSVPSITLAGGEYHLRCAQLHLSLPAAEFTAHALTLDPTLDEAAFFAADTFRRIRYRASLTSLTLRGIAIPELLRGEAYRAASLELHAPQFESYVNREKPRRPPTRVLPMPHEALAALEKPLRLDRLTVTDGTLRIMARRSASAEPGVLTFAAFGLTARDIANTSAGGQIIQLQAQSRLMDAAPLTVDMSIPVAPDALAFRYSGKLGAMDLTRLNAYLSGTGGFEIKSGRADGAEFSVDVVGGHARGILQGIYRDLQVTVLDRETGEDDGLTTRVATVLANQLRVRHDNTPDASGKLKEGKIDYTRAPEDTFLPFSWAALRTGLKDLLTL